MILADNRASLVAVAARLRVSEPRLWTDRPVMDRAGRLVALPGSGGVTLGIHAGDGVRQRVADHAIPGISLEDLPGTGGAHGLICVGNRVRRLDGKTVGAVAGERGGLAPGFLRGQYIGVEASDDVLQGMAPGEEVVVESYGRGLALTDFSQLMITNCSPAALDALPIQVTDGALAVGVRAEFPSVWAGPGLGTDVWVGDLEVAVPVEAQPNDLCYGDVVAFGNIDGRVSRFHREGYVAVGVVSHGPSPVAGHGTGVTILLSGPDTMVRTVRDAAASLAPFLRDPSQDSWRYIW